MTVRDNLLLPNSVTDFSYPFFFPQLMSHTVACVHCTLLNFFFSVNGWVYSSTNAQAWFEIERSDLRTIWHCSRQVCDDFLDLAGTLKQELFKLIGTCHHFSLCELQKPSDKWWCTLRLMQLFLCTWFAHHCNFRVICQCLMLAIKKEWQKDGSIEWPLPRTLTRC